MQERIGVHGGTFNPIHNGHLHIQREFAKRLQLNQLIVMPTYEPPHKKQDCLASARDRLCMCRLAVAADPLLTVSDLEIQRGGKSYTLETLYTLKTLYPDSSLWLLMGEDMFVTLEKWRGAPEIFRTAEICVAPRSVYGLPRLKHLADNYQRTYQARIRIEQISFLDISSTAIRNRICKGLPITGLVPKTVAEYIDQHKIYQT